MDQENAGIKQLMNGSRPVIRLRRTQSDVGVSRRKIAQDLYYARKGQGQQGTSPLIRSIAALQETSKPPVHLRLGRKDEQKKIILRRMHNNRNNAVLNRRTPVQLKRTNVKNGVASTKTFIRRRHSAQERITNIRRQQHSLENLVQLNNNQVIKLRRRKPLTQQGPTNLMVQFENSSYSNKRQHSVQSSITPGVQAQIRVLQSEINFNPDINIILPEPLFVPGIGLTIISLNERFSRLP